MTPLRQRMREDLQLRNYAPETIENYLRCVAHCAQRSSVAERYHSFIQAVSV